MKKTYTYEITSHIAFDRNKYCSCGSHIYEIWHQIAPKDKDYGIWFVHCPNCGRESPERRMKELAISAWKNS